MTAMIHIHGPQDGNFLAQFLTRDGRSLTILVPDGLDDDDAARSRPMKDTRSGA